MKNKNQKEFSSGFSLIELVIVIGMVGIMAAVTVPMMTQRMPEYKLRRATQDIILCLQEAKMKAVNENKTVTVTFSEADNRYTAEVDGAPYKSMTLPANMEFYKELLSLDEVKYTSRGFLETAKGSIYLQNNQSNYRKITLNRSGNIRVQKVQTMPPGLNSDRHYL